MKKWYDIKAAAPGRAEIYIYEEIGMWGVSAKQFATDLKALGSICLLYTSPSPRDRTRSRMPSSA